jgi:hypothetical protein
MVDLLLSPSTLLIPSPNLDDVNGVPDDDENGNFPLVRIDDLDWELVKYTVDGGLGNCHAGDPSRGIAYFAVRRRCVSKRLDHICEVGHPYSLNILSWNRYLFFIAMIQCLKILKLLLNPFSQKILI